MGQSSPANKSPQQGIPKRFLEQILADLKSARFVTSKRGIAGGYRLARPPEQITLASVVRHIEGALAPVSCVSERFYEKCSCPDESRCAIRSVMKEIREAVVKIAERVTIAELLELQGVLNLVEAVKKKGIKKIIYISVVGAGAESLSESYQSKYQAEEAIRNSGIDYTVFKPSGLFKDFDAFHIPTVIKAGETNKWPFGPIDFHMNPLSHIDLAKCTCGRA